MKTEVHRGTETPSWGWRRRPGRVLAPGLETVGVSTIPCERTFGEGLVLPWKWSSAHLRI